MSQLCSLVHLPCLPLPLLHVPPAAWNWARSELEQDKIPMLIRSWIAPEIAICCLFNISSNASVQSLGPG